MGNGSMAEQLEQHPIVRQTRLYLTTVAALRKRNGNTITAGRDIAAAIQNDLNSIKELCGEDLQQLIERKAYELARRVHADQAGAGLKGDGGRRDIAASQPSNAPTPKAWSPEDICEHEEAGPRRSANGQRPFAQPLRDGVDGGEGRLGIAEKAAPTMPSSPSSEIAGLGRPAPANGLTTSAKPRDSRMPGHARRGGAVIANVQNTIIKGLLDTYRVRDGRIIGGLTLRELENMAKINLREAAIFERVLKHAANGAPHQLVRDIVSDETLERIIREVDEADASK